MTVVPPVLLERYGEPERSGDWYRWSLGRGGSEDVLLWKPGMAYALDKATGRRVWTGEKAMPSIGLPDGVRGSIDWSVFRAPTGERRAYLKARGLTEEEIGLYGLEDPEEPLEVVLPVLEDGKACCWQARRIDDGHPKYRTPRGVATGKYVWGLDRVHPGQTVYVCEGVFTALHFPRGVATLGRRITGTQAVKVLDRCPSLVLFCCDRDREGSEEELRRKEWETRNVFKRLTGKDRIGWLFPPVGTKDFGELLARGLRWKE